MIGRPYRKVIKDWGHELWLANGPYCGKVLHIDPGKGMRMLHYHAEKHETIYVAEGAVLVYLLEPTTGRSMPHLMEQGTVIVLQPYQEHAFANASNDVPAKLFEVSTQHLDEDSIHIFDVDEEIFDGS